MAVWRSAAVTAALAVAVVVLSAAPAGAVLVRRGGEGPRLVSFLDTKAKQLSSVELTVLAHSAAGAGGSPDSMDKVKNMIRHMITEKQADLAESVTQSEYCKKELPKATAELKKLKEDMDQRSADHDALEARIAQLNEDIAQIASQVAATRSNLTAEGQAREKQHAAYAERKAKYEAVDVEDRTEGGMDEHLKVETEEASRDLAFKRLQQDGMVSIAKKEQESKHIQTDIVKMQARMAELERDGRLQQDVLDSAKSYKQQLDKQCVVKKESYAERKRRRDQVIESMKDAYVILGGDV